MSAKASKKRSSSPVPSANDDSKSDGKKSKSVLLALIAEEEEYQPTRIVKVSSGASSAVSLEAIVLRTDRSTKPTREGKVMNKQEVTVAVRHVRANGAEDFLPSSLPGIGFILPTSKKELPKDADEGPEANVANRSAANAKKDKQPTPRELVLNPHSKVYPTQFIRASVIANSPSSDGASNGNDASKQKIDTDLIKPGAFVELSGNVANLAPDGSLWLNTAKITPLRPDIPSGCETQYMIKEFLQQETALSAAHVASSCVNGFFGADFSSNPDREHQADVFRQLWKCRVDGTAAACERLASTLRSSSKSNEPNALVLDEFADRIKKTNCADVASGAQMLFIPPVPPTQDRPPEVATLVQYGKLPSMPLPGYLMDLWEGGNIDHVPKTFCMLDVKEVKITSNLVELVCAVHFVGDKDAAAASFASNRNPVLSTKFGALGLKLSLGNHICKWAGTVEQLKAGIFAREVLPYADFAVAARVSPKPWNTDGCACLFPEAILIDPLSIGNVAMPVSADFVQQHLCSGEKTYVHELNDRPKVVDKQGQIVTITPPGLKEKGYQAISETGFNLGTTKTPVDKPNKKYFVLFDGCRKRVEEEGSFEVSAGEKEVKDAAAKEEGSVYDFLTAKAIVYCIAYA